jgi:hypothetical protein
VAEERTVEPCSSGQVSERRRTKAQLQRQMNEARNSISDTIEEIKGAVEKQYEAVKRTVDGVLDWREQFQKEPIVWSVGALSAGFALGYTLGYTHKHVGRPRRSRSGVAAFADSLIDELSSVGHSLVMPSLNIKIKEMFGFDLSDLLEEIGRTKKVGAKRRRATQTATRRRRTSSRRRRRPGTRGGEVAPVSSEASAIRAVSALPPR